MTRAQLAKVENMKSLPSWDTLNRYAEGLGLAPMISFEPLDEE